MGKKNNRQVVILKEDLLKRKMEINEIKKKAKEARRINESEKSERLASLNEDLRYIEQEIIAKQKNGKYCKFSKSANSITAYNLSFYSMLSYWLKNAESKRASVKYKEELTDLLVYKVLGKGITSLDKVIELEKNSDDSEETKKQMIALITNKY